METSFHSTAATATASWNVGGRVAKRDLGARQFAAMGCGGEARRVTMAIRTGMTAAAPTVRWTLLSHAQVHIRIGNAEVRVINASQAAGTEQ